MEIQQLAPKVYQSFQTILKKDRLSHAYLFSGDYANFEMAIFLSQSVFCTDKIKGLPCGVCRSCQLIHQNEFSDVTILEPSGQVIKTEAVKEMMKNFSQTGYESEHQVFIIRDCEKMHTNAANSLLKYIEEPQSSSYIFLLTNDDSKVLPTIKSRTQIFHFSKDESSLSQEAQKLGLLKTQADLVAQLAKNHQEMTTYANNPKTLELLAFCQKFAYLLNHDKQKAYIEVSRFNQVASEKKDQDMVLSLLMLILAKDYTQPKAISFLDKLFLAREMWQSNVNFQNVLEYMVIS